MSGTYSDSNRHMLEKNKIQNIILGYCYDDKPSDCEWTLSKSDIPEMVEKIKEAILRELDGSEHLDDARSYVKEYL